MKIINKMSIIIICLTYCLLLVSGCSKKEQEPERLPLKSNIELGMKLDEAKQLLDLKILEDTNDSQEATNHIQGYDIGTQKIYSQSASICLNFSKFDKGNFDGRLIGYYAKFNSACKPDKLVEGFSAHYGDANVYDEETYTGYTWRYGSVDKLDDDTYDKIKELFSSAYTPMSDAQEKDSEIYYDSLIQSSYPLLEVSLIVPKNITSENPIRITADGQYLALWLLSK